MREWMREWMNEIMSEWDYLLLEILQQRPSSTAAFTTEFNNLLEFIQWSLYQSYPSLPHLPTRFSFVSLLIVKAIEFLSIIIVYHSIRIIFPIIHHTLRLETITTCSTTLLIIILHSSIDYLIIIIKRLRKVPMNNQTNIILVFIHSFIQILC